MAGDAGCADNLCNCHICPSNAWLSAVSIFSDNLYASMHMCPGFDSTRYLMWDEFVVGSRPAPMVLLRVLRLSALHKNQDLRPG